jgi:hypothetical protein
MGIGFAGRAAVILIILSLFSCGELETLFPESESYQVKTLVNGVSLEDCSIVRSNDKIRPSFAVPVADDPDLISLLVYLQNSHDEVVGGRVFYTLHAYASVPVIEEPEEDEAEEIEEEPEERGVWELPEHGATSEKWSFTNTRPEKKNTDTEIAVKSFGDELPYFPLPKNLEIGQYTLIFEALGKKETLSRTETDIFYLGGIEFNLKDIAMYLPGSSSGSQLIAPKTTVMLEAGLDFDSRLDPYVIWYNGKNIISKGKISDGAGSILWTAPGQAGFYALRMEAFPFFLKRSFVGISREITLPVSPKAVSLDYFFKNDSNYTGQSPLAEGTVYPEQVQLITTMISSEDSPAFTPVMPSPPKLSQWYQFEGNLRSATSALTDEPSLIPMGEQTLHWAAAGQSYGLITGSDDVYLLSPIKFFRAEQNHGGGIFLLHIRPPVNGTILNVFFPLQSSAANGVSMNLVKGDNIIVLRLSAGTTTVEIPIHAAFSESSGFIPVVIEFYIRPYRLEAKISLGEEQSLQNKTGDIKLPSVLSGEGIIKLGGGPRSSPEKPKTENSSTTPTVTELQTEETPEKEIAIEDAEEDILTVVETLISFENNFPENTIWDELAILLSTVPIIQEGIHEEVITENYVMTDQNLNMTTDNMKTEGEKIGILPLTNTDTTVHESNVLIEL